MNQTRLIISSNGYKTEHILESFNKDAITFGRDPRCDIVINNQKVSTYHGYIYRYQGKWYIKDQNSLNGILINNVKITESELRDGARITLDRYVAADSVVMEFRVTQQNPAMRYQSPPPQNRQAVQPQRQAQAAAQKKEQEAQNRKGNIGLALGITSLALVVILMVVVGIYIFGKDDDDKKAQATTEQTTVASTEATTEAVTEAQTEEGKKMTGEEVYNLANPSTVEIIAVISDQYGSLGTGFYIDDHGTIVTNYHVIDQAKSAIIRTSDGTEYNIDGVTGYDTEMDLAILTTSATNTVPLEQRTGEVNTGEKVYALGNSQGYQGTFTEGIVSQAKREEKGHTYIQHSAPITNGNSGGPLLDEEGKVIGINNWVRTDGQNLNFAIPIAEVANISIDGNLSLEQVYEEVYGSGSYEPTYSTADWESVTLAESGASKITVRVPRESSLTEEDGMKSYDYTTSNGGINISGELELGDYSSVTSEDMENLDEEVISEISGRITTMFDNGYDTSAEGCTINGRNWRLYTFSGLSNGYDTELYVLVTCDANAIACVYMISMSQNDDADIRQKVIDIMSSIEYN